MRRTDAVLMLGVAGVSGMPTRRLANLNKRSQPVNENLLGISAD